MVKALKGFSVLLSGVLILAIAGCTSVQAQMAYHKGEEAIDAKDYDTAIEEYTKAINADPEDSRAALYREGEVIKGASYNNRGVAYWYKGDKERAIADFNAALRINPGLTDAKNNLEQIQTGGAPPAAIVIYTGPGTGTGSGAPKSYVNPLNLTIPLTTAYMEGLEEYFTPQEYDPSNPILGRWETTKENTNNGGLDRAPGWRSVAFYSFLADGRYYYHNVNQQKRDGEWQSERRTNYFNGEQREIDVMSMRTGQYIVQGDTVYFSNSGRTSERKFSVSADGQTLSLPLAPNPFDSVNYTRK